MKALFHQKSGRISPSETLTPTSQHKQRSPRVPKENVDPSPTPPENPHVRSPFSVKPLHAKNRSPLPPRPPPHSGGNPLKRKLCLEGLPENVGVPASAATDSGVQVIVRMRPPCKDEEEGETIVHKVSGDTVSVLDHTFTFDSVADTTSTQQDIFQLVGIPLVENCLCGFNSSIFAYGQTGSGKTYTMWGPPSALSEDDLLGNERGLTPRVFEQLFSRISEEQLKHSDKQLEYQCRCSFLEIYNEQINDLLDLSQRNLQVREDVKTGVYVDYLSEEHVWTMKDVTNLLLKGLANRLIGATSINAESSRSHCVFTCVVESRFKSIADGSSSVRTSRINLVDLAGSERQKLTGAAGERLKEAGNINRSLSQLGNLINILAEVSQSGKQRHIPYRDSRLTFLLQESLGGNAKLAMICAISPSQSCKSETFSTLRFAQRAKAIKNKAVVNEIRGDDVQLLREQIRQLKDELLRMKSFSSSTVDNNGSYSNGWNARRSLNLLRQSLSRPMALPIIEDDDDEVMEIDEEAVERPCPQACRQSAASADNINYMPITPTQLVDIKEVSRSYSHKTDLRDLPPSNPYVDGCGSGQPIKVVDITMEICETGEVVSSQHKLNLAMPECDSTASDQKEVSQPNVKLLVCGSTDETVDEKSLTYPEKKSATDSKLLEKIPSACPDCTVGRDTADASHDSSAISPNCTISTSLSLMPNQTSPVQAPSISTSPRVDSSSRKSLRTSSSISASQKDLSETVHSVSGVLEVPSGDNLNNSSSTASHTQTSKSSLAPTEHLAASLHRGLQIMDNYNQNSPLRHSLFKFSFRPIDLKPLLPVSKADIGVQTLSQELEAQEASSPYICSYCKDKPPPLDYKDVAVDTNLQLVPVDAFPSADKSKRQVPKAVEKVLTGAIRREMALEDHCAKQAAQIVQLNRLVQQYKHERECNAIIERSREDKISRLEQLMDGILSTEGFMEEEAMSLTNELKILTEKYENHPEVLRVSIELKRVQDELDTYRNFFDLGERDVLMEEIEDLRTQLQCYVDSSHMSTGKRSLLLLLTQPSETIPAPLSGISELTEGSTESNFEQERLRWTELESKWISLSEELRVELEASRALAEKHKVELDSERKCSEELKEALQTAMQGHARILDQYAELQEKHIGLLARHRKIRDGIADVKRAAARAGVKGAESRFINSLASEISALKVEREKERRYWRDENNGLQAQLRDTAEAVQAAGELLVRLKEAEEAAATAQNRTQMAEKEAKRAHQEIENLKKKHERELVTLNQFLAESRLPKEALRPAYSDSGEAKYDGGNSLTDQQWKEEFEPFCQGGGHNEFSREEPSSWFSGYDRCNI